MCNNGCCMRYVCTARLRLPRGDDEVKGNNERNKRQRCYVFRCRACGAAAVVQCLRTRRRTAGERPPSPRAWVLAGRDADETAVFGLWSVHAKDLARWVRQCGERCVLRFEYLGQVQDYREDLCQFPDDVYWQDEYCITFLDARGELWEQRELATHTVYGECLVPVSPAKLDAVMEQVDRVVCARM